MREGELLEKAVKTIDKVVLGTGLGGLAGAMLRDPKFPDPVVPPDLHLVKPAKVDADGNVNCVYCGRSVKWEAAQMVGSAGFECGTCQHAYNYAATPLDTKISPKKWPWIVVGVIVLGAGIGVWQYYAARDRAALAKEFPVAATDADLDIIDRNVDRWTDGMDKLAVAAGNRPPVESLKLGGACDVSIDAPNRVPDGASPAEIRRGVEHLVELAERGRFRDEYERLSTVQSMTAPVLVVKYHERLAPRLDDTDPENPTYELGKRAGTAYVFDADGSLRCAGAWEATSSEAVEYKKYKTGYEEADKRFDDSDRRWAEMSLVRDLDDQTAKAIAASLKKVD